ATVLVTQKDAQLCQDTVGRPCLDKTPLIGMISGVLIVLKDASLHLDGNAADGEWMCIDWWTWWWEDNPNWGRWEDNNHPDEKAEQDGGDQKEDWNNIQHPGLNGILCRMA
ncbi:hypothetical protein AAF712_016225, partial [Marasmius tenuissimus]